MSKIVSKFWFLVNNNNDYHPENKVNVWANNKLENQLFSPKLDLPFWIEKKYYSKTERKRGKNPSSI